MGAHPWFYFVAYHPDIEAALQSLKKREFEAGRYNPAVRFPQFPLTANSFSPGAKHASIEDAVNSADADGTRSILDIEHAAQQRGYGSVSPLSDERLVELFGTTLPSHTMIETNTDFFDEIARGQGIYIVVYDDDQPSELFFAGYSYD